MGVWKSRCLLAVLTSLSLSIVLTSAAGASSGAASLKQPQGQILIHGQPQAAVVFDDQDTGVVEDMMPVVAEQIFVMGLERGFAGLHTDYGTLSIVVYWKGLAPRDVVDYVQSTPEGIRVHLVEGVPFSRLDGEVARNRLIESGQLAGFGVVSISVNGDGSGLTLGSTVAEPGGDWADKLGELAAMPVSLVGGVAKPVGYAARDDDSAPWKGGGRSVHVGLGQCTVGFAVLDGPYGRLISANHCDPQASATVKDGGGDKIAEGSTVGEIPALDSLLYDPTASPATTPAIYWGAWNTNNTKTVKNWATNWPGDPVCSSGASTGKHCGEVYDDNDTVRLHGHWVPVIQVAAPVGDIMGGQGDSGGPMAKLLSNGVQARGILLGPDPDFGQTYDCGTTDPGVGTILCSRHLNYVPISTILNAWGVSLEVG